MAATHKSHTTSIITVGMSCVQERLLFFPSKNKDYRESNSNCNKNRLKNIHKRQRTFRDGKATFRRIPRFQLEYELINQFALNIPMLLLWLIILFILSNKACVFIFPNKTESEM